MSRIEAATAVGVALAFGSLAPGFAQAQERTEPHVSVSGSAEVRVVPDIVEIVFGVESQDPSLQAARAANEAAVRSVLAAAEGVGIPPQDQQTDHLGIDPHYNSHEPWPRRVVGYSVRRTIVLTLRDTARFEELLEQALASGANHLHGVTFRTSRLRQHRDEARAMAVRLAREKAGLLAREAGRKPGAARTIQEHESYDQVSWYGGYWGSGWRFGPTQVSSAAEGRSLEGGSLALGQISIRATLAMRFELR